MIAGLAVAAGQIEIALQVARLPRDVHVLQYEVVRVEQAAQVDVGEYTRSRRVTRALERVELDRGKRVTRCQLVDDEHRAARPKDAGHLRDHELRPHDVVERTCADDEIERSAL